MSVPEDSPPGGEAQPEVWASDGARIYQAARDQYVAERDLHLHYETGVRRARRALAAGEPDAECPYPGLAAFAEAQSHWFFGRDALTAELLVRLDERLRQGGALVVVAPSGAGKSSLLHAALLPALARGALPAPGSAHWPRLLITPTPHPMGALSTSLDQALGIDLRDADRGPLEYAARVLDAVSAGGAPGRRLVLVVDQAEELFTLCGNERERRDFLDVLTVLAAPHPSTGGPAALVVLGLRSDFYTPCADYPQLRSALQDRQLVVGSMTRAELQEAIVFPAEAVGLELEPGLVELLLGDLGVATGEDGSLSEAGTPQGYEAGRLPLLAHALRATWQQRHGQLLTVEGYRLTGGIRNAVTTTADRIFTRLDPEGQRIARTLFLRLVKIGDGAEDTRRRVAHADLLGTGPDTADTAAVITAFTQGRLLTHHRETVQITHEVLLQAWPRLRSWIEADRSGHLLHQSLEEAAAAWRDARHDTSMLYRGQRLETTRAWIHGAGQDQSSEVASAFFAASIQHARRGTRIRRAAIAILTALAVLATTAAVLALQQRSSLQAQRDEAVFNRVKTEGGGLRESQASLAAQLNLVALGMRPGDADLRTRLIEDASQPLSQPLSGGKGPFESVVFSRDGKLLAAGSDDGSVQLWQFGGSSKARLIGRTRSDPSGGPVYAVAMAAEGRLLATANQDGSLRLFDISDAAHPRLLGHTPTSESAPLGVAVSPDGKLMASAPEDAWTDLWDISNPRRPLLLSRAKEVDSYATIGSVAISSTGRYLATTEGVGDVQLWDIRHPATPVRLGRITDFPHSFAGPVTPEGAVVFSPDEKTLASGAADNMVRLWDISDKRHPYLLGLPLPDNLSTVTGLAFSSDGRTLATTSGKNTVYIFNLADLQDVHLVQALHGNLVGSRAVAFRPHDDSLVTVGPNPATPLWWHLRRTILNRHQGLVASVAFNRVDGSMTTVANDGAICRWNIRTVLHPDLLDCGRFAGPSRAMFTDTWLEAAVSSDGRTMALSDTDTGQLQLWDITAIHDPKRLKILADSHDFSFRSLAFSPDGRVLAAVGGQEPFQLWDVSDPRHARVLHQFPQNTKAAWEDQLTFSPDGRLLATLASSDGRVALWNVTDPRHPIQAGHTKRNQPPGESSTAMAFSPTGDLIATGSDSGRIRLWSVTRSGTLLAKGTAVNPTPVGNFWTLSFSPDEHLLATGGSDSTIRLWDVSDPAHPTPFGLPLTGHTRAVHTVAFAPSSPVIVSDSYDSTIRLWPTETSVDTTLVCMASAGTLTPTERKLHLSGLVYDSPCP
ncbi:WD40 repeat domain-containing protein [Streptomyces sp. NPDC048324]|uniref:WD40 repeat domain-containing protein n=1 Tax=Streptomyces sp. NPDC048324 TaxID=3157205 RepID=UPI003431EF0A